MNLNRLFEWPLSLRLLIIGLMNVVIFALIYEFDISGLNNQLQQARRQEQDLKQELGMTLNLQTTIQKNLSQFQPIDKQLTDWKKKLVSYSQLPKLMNQILKIAASNHVVLNSVSPQPAEGETADFKLPEKPAATGTTAATKEEPPKTMPITYYKLPIKIEAVASYEDFGHMLSQISELPNIVVVNDLELSKTKEKEQALTMKMTLEVYYLENK